jgi:hypothetical protein
VGTPALLELRLGPIRRGSVNVTCEVSNSDWVGTGWPNRCTWAGRITKACQYAPVPCVSPSSIQPAKKRCPNRSLDGEGEPYPGAPPAGKVPYRTRLLAVQQMGRVPLLSSRRGQGWSLQTSNTQHRPSPCLPKNSAKKFPPRVGVPAPGRSRVVTKRERPPNPHATTRAGPFSANHPFNSYSPSR